MLAHFLPARQALAAGCPLCRHSRSLATPSSSSSASSRAGVIPPAVLDLTEILNDPEYIKQNLRDRRFPLGVEVVDEIRRMELEAIGLRRELQRARERRNAVSTSPSGSKGPPSDASAKSEGAVIKALVKSLEPRLSLLTKTLQSLALQLPNTSHPSSPIGDESAAITVATFGPSIPSAPPPAEIGRAHV